MSTIFIKFLFFNKDIEFQKLWKMLFIFSKKLFSSSSYSNFWIPVLSFFLPVGHCLRRWSKLNLKVYNVINCLNKNLITNFVWYFEKKKRYDIETLPIDGVSDKRTFLYKNHSENVQQKLVPDLFIITQNSHCIQKNF